MGVICFELLTGCSPFTVDGAANSSKEIAKRIITKKVPFPKNMDPDARDFIAALLEKRLEKRLGYNGVEEIKNHRFLRDLDWDKVAKRQLTPFIVPNLTHELMCKILLLNSLISRLCTHQPNLQSTGIRFSG
ncbi:hypothetical protein OSTOST_18978, partial [Ostertagia ostertagi]